ncbi:MAG: IS1182 family transposase [Planctomycetota bacterium]|jgi:transposase
MSLKAQPIPPVPEATAEAARAAFRKGNIYMQMRDELGSIYTDDLFSDLYPPEGQPAIAPWRLALVTVMQFAENLSDRQAAEAVRARIDWKYALSLELSDAGFDYSVLSEFRARLIEQDATGRLLEALLGRFKEKGLLKGKRQQRTDSTHVLAAVRDMNRLENVGETLRATLDCLATVAPDWLVEHIPTEWFDRYGKRFENWRLPQTKAERQALAEMIGTDGYYLLEAVAAASDLPWMRDLPAVRLLRRLWVQQYWCDNGQVKQRLVKDMPPESTWIRSPYDDEARYCTKRSKEWVGYRTHITETCDEGHPRLITHVETSEATLQDCEIVDKIQGDLAANDLRPELHLVDAGYVDAENLAHSQHEHGIDLFGPTRPDTSWQAQSDQGLDMTQFVVDWEAQSVTCPAGQHSVVWAEGLSQYGTPVIRVHFSPAACRICELRPRCTRGFKRGLTLRLQVLHEALQQARQREQTDAFWAIYRKRAGVEGTISQALRVCGMRRSRYIGLAKTHLHCVAAAAAINLFRAINWLNEIPLAATRTSRLAALAA